jgi:hypothetical protein
MVSQAIRRIRLSDPHDISSFRISAWGGPWRRKSARSMEAGRIELPSVKGSLQPLRACSAIRSRSDNCRQTGHHQGQCSVESHSSPRAHGIGASLLDYAFPLNRHRRFNVAVVKPRELTVCQHLVFSRIFYEANRGPRRATTTSTNTSKPVAPLKKGLMNKQDTSR